MADIKTLREGLAIIEKYVVDDEDECAVGADILYAPGVEVGPEDKARLIELGWFEDKSTDSWAVNI